MARLIAFVLAAGQTVRARRRTHVIDVDATLLVAFVFAAAPFLCAAFLAAGVIGAGQQVDALHHLIHVTATTFDTRLLIAWRTWTVVTLGCKNQRKRTTRYSSRSKENERQEEKESGSP